MLVTNSYAICSSYARPGCQWKWKQHLLGRTEIQKHRQNLVLQSHLHVWTQFFVDDWFIILLLFGLWKSWYYWQTIYPDFNLMHDFFFRNIVSMKFSVFFPLILPLRYNLCFLSFFQYVLPRTNYSAYFLLFLIQATCIMGCKIYIVV
jgi:hypothetical protein